MPSSKEIVLQDAVVKFSSLLSQLLIDEHLTPASVQYAVKSVKARLRLQACPMRILELIAMEMVMLKYPPGAPSNDTSFEVEIPNYGYFTITEGRMTQQQRASSAKLSLSDWVRLMGCQVDLPASMKPDCKRTDFSQKVYKEGVVASPEHLCTVSDILAVWDSVWNNDALRISAEDKMRYEEGLFKNVALRPVLFGSSDMSIGAIVDKGVDAMGSCISFFGSALAKTMAVVPAMIDNPVFRHGIENCIEGFVTYAGVSGKVHGAIGVSLNQTPPERFAPGSHQEAIWRAIFQFKSGGPSVAAPHGGGKGLHKKKGTMKTHAKQKNGNKNDA